MSEPIGARNSDDVDDVDDVDGVDEPETKSCGKRNKHKNTDLMKITGNLLSNINYKIAFLLFAIGMIIFSDVFIEGVLAGIPGSVDGECTTTKGTMLQLLFMVIGYIIIDLLDKYDII